MSKTSIKVSPKVGQHVDRFVATAGQTIFPLTFPIRQDVSISIAGAELSNMTGIIANIGDSQVTMPAQNEFESIVIKS